MAYTADYTAESPGREQKKTKGDDRGLVRDCLDEYARCLDAAEHNRSQYLEDVRFARDGEQWPDDIKKQREIEQRPCLTINKMPSFIRQVVNDGRQNKPAIHVHPADSFADPEVAQIYAGLIRNIEYMSNADVAYDTAAECAVQGGFGYWKIALDYAFDDSFDLDIKIERVRNPLSVLGDPNSRRGDSSDWNVAFDVTVMSQAEFKRTYPKADMVDFDDDAWSEGRSKNWVDDKNVTVAEWWTRTETERKIVELDNGTVWGEDEIQQVPQVMAMIEQGLLKVNRSRSAKTYEVVQRIMSGAEVLEENDWPGKYIPIVPVYGEEYDIEGKQYLRSLVYHSKDAQRMFNFWRTASTELVALAPRVPYIGPKGAFASDKEKWEQANRRSFGYMEYDIEPVARAGRGVERHPLDGGVAAGAIQEAMNASDDLKSTMGLFDASLGARSNETSGKAIIARQREGDVSTFHFHDNTGRAIRHTGRILIDLIPKVYSSARVVRILGEDGKDREQPINQLGPALDKNGQPLIDEFGQALTRMYDLTVGKYDLTVKPGPSYTTRREEAAEQMSNIMQGNPQSFPILAKHLARNLDWPGADEIADELEDMAKNQVPPQLQKMMEQGKQQIEKLTAENQQLKMDRSSEEQDFALKREEFAAKKETAEAEMELKWELAKAEVAIEEYKATNQARLANDKAQQERTIKQMEVDEVTDENAKMIMEGLQQLGQMIVDQGQITNQHMERLAEIAAADKELIFDEKTGRTKGSRLVMPNMQ